MELKDRLRLIVQEQKLRQKDLAATIKVTESYVSNMLNGKRSNISEALALLIEQAYGYSAHWILTGEGDCHAFSLDAHSQLSPTKKRLIAKIEKMSDQDLEAVNVFIDSLDRYKKAFRVGDAL